MVAKSKKSSRLLLEMTKGVLNRGIISNLPQTRMNNKITEQKKTREHKITYYLFLDTTDIHYGFHTLES